MERFREFDYAVDGEGEKILVELLQVLETGGNPFSVPGIIFRKGPFVHQTQGKAINKDRRSSMPAWTCCRFPARLYSGIYDYPRGPVPRSRLARLPFTASSAIPPHLRQRALLLAEVVFQMMSTCARNMAYATSCLSTICSSPAACASPNCANCSSRAG